MKSTGPKKHDTSKAREIAAQHLAADTVTIADLAAEGRQLLVWCRCGHCAELDARKLPLGQTPAAQLMSPPKVDRWFCDGAKALTAG